MYSQRITEVHGHSVSELAELLRNSWDVSKTDCMLNSVTLGGWTSFNILVESKGARYVLKLPAIIGHHEANPYRYQFNAASQISREGLCPRPVEIGRFSNRNETPYCIYEYVEGQVRPSISSFSQDDLHEISSHLSRLSNLNPTDLKAFSKPSDYLSHIVQNTKSVAEMSTSQSTLLRTSLDKLVSTLDYTDEIDSNTKWSSKLMHGDLHESNIVFRADGLYFLDLEACCYGEPLYDFSYILIESDEDDSSSDLESLKASQMDSETSWALDILATVSVTAWTIERLLYIEADRVDPLLASVETRNAMFGYLNAKLSILSELGRGK
ncbi:MAG: aminoglycoside phosphotransferase family protein [Candidatus Thorarchaeota archaeon]